jgi:hypothetical protein
VASTWVEASELTKIMAPEPHMRRSISVAVKLLDHFGGDADSDGAEGDVVSNKTEGLFTHHTAFADTIIFKRP